MPRNIEALIDRLAEEQPIHAGDPWEAPLDAEVVELLDPFGA